MSAIDPALTQQLVAAMSERATKLAGDDLKPILLLFLDVLDAVDRLVVLAEGSEVSEAPKGTRWLDHMLALQQQLLDVFAQLDVVFFDSVNHPFDPAKHEAVRTVERDDVPDYVILSELSRGCKRSGQVVRVARVVVARHPQADVKDLDTNSE